MAISSDSGSAIDDSFEPTFFPHVASSETGTPSIEHNSRQEGHWEVTSRLDSFVDDPSPSSQEPMSPAGGPGAADTLASVLLLRKLHRATVETKLKASQKLRLDSAGMSSGDKKLDDVEQKSEKAKAVFRVPYLPGASQALLVDQIRPHQPALESFSHRLAARKVAQGKERSKTKHDLESIDAREHATSSTKEGRAPASQTLLQSPKLSRLTGRSGKESFVELSQPPQYPSHNDKALAHSLSNANVGPLFTKARRSPTPPLEKGPLSRAPNSTRLSLQRVPKKAVKAERVPKQRKVSQRHELTMDSFTHQTHRSNSSESSFIMTGALPIPSSRVSTSSFRIDRTKDSAIVPGNLNSRQRRKPINEASVASSRSSAKLPRSPSRTMTISVSPYDRQISPQILPDVNSQTDHREPERNLLDGFREIGQGKIKVAGANLGPKCRAPSGHTQSSSSTTVRSCAPSPRVRPDNESPILFQRVSSLPESTNEQEGRGSDRTGDHDAQEQETVFAGKGWISPHPLSVAPSPIASPPQSVIQLPGTPAESHRLMTYKEWKRLREDEGVFQLISVAYSDQNLHGKPPHTGLCCNTSATVARSENSHGLENSRSSSRTDQDLRRILEFRSGNSSQSKPSLASRQPHKQRSLEARNMSESISGSNEIHDGYGDLRDWSSSARTDHSIHSTKCSNRVATANMALALLPTNTCPSEELLNSSQLRFSESSSNSTASNSTRRTFGEAYPAYQGRVLTAYTGSSDVRSRLTSVPSGFIDPDVSPHRSAAPRSAGKTESIYDVRPTVHLRMPWGASPVLQDTWSTSSHHSTPSVSQIRSSEDCYAASRM